MLEQRIVFERAASTQQRRFDSQMAKAAVDALAQQASFDTQLALATAAMTNMKAAYELSASDQMATFDKEMAKSESEVAGIRIAYDKLFLDNSLLRASTIQVRGSTPASGNYLHTWCVSANIIVARLYPTGPNDEVTMTHKISQCAKPKCS